MKTQTEKLELLWRLADGDCTPKEEKQAQAWIMADEKVKWQWEEIQQLSQQLKTDASAEEPSMRFKTNILERLPAARASRSLIPAKWKPWLIAGFVLGTLLSTLSTGGNTRFDLIQEWNFSSGFSLQHWLQPILDLRISAYTGFLLIILLLLVIDRFLINKPLQERGKTND